MFRDSQYVTSGGVMNLQPIGWQTDSPDRELSSIATMFEIAGDVLRNVGQLSPVLAIQQRLARTLIWQKVGQELWSQAPATGAPAGMVSLAALNPNGVIDAGAGSLSLDLLDGMKTRMPTWDFGPDVAYVMNSRTFYQLQSIARTANAPVEWLTDPDTGERLPTWGGFRILLCDWISLAETTLPDTTSVYLVRLRVGPGVPHGMKNFSIGVLAGQPDVEYSPLKPKSGAVDIWQSTATLRITFLPGSRTSVLRMMNLQTPSAPPS